MANFVLQILSLTSLISSYSLSVLYLDELDGIKFSDYQLTLTGVCMTASHLAVSHASPLKHISARPQAKKKKALARAKRGMGLALNRPSLRGAELAEPVGGPDASGSPTPSATRREISRRVGGPTLAREWPRGSLIGQT